MRKITPITYSQEEQQAILHRWALRHTGGVSGAAQELLAEGMRRADGSAPTLAELTEYLAAPPELAEA